MNGLLIVWSKTKLLINGGNQGETKIGFAFILFGHTIALRTPPLSLLENDLGLLSGFFTDLA
jgi:hypothetical protein